MKFLTVFIAATMPFNFFSFGQKGEHETNKVFNEGVTLSIQSSEAHEKRNSQKAVALNKKALEKFRLTYQLDPKISAIRGAIGHCLYLDKQYPEAIIWVEQANKVNGEATINFREMGLCRIGMGYIAQGKADLDKAFLLNKINKIRQITIEDLSEIAELVFSHTNSYSQQSEPIVQGL